MYRILPLALAFGISGCGARAEVAKDRIVAQIDALLGEVAVKRKEAEIAVRNLQDGVDQYKKAKIELKVRLSQISEKLGALDSKIENADRALGRLRDYLKQESEVEISGKQFTAAQLKTMAETTISARKKLDAEADALRRSQTRLEGILVSIERREEESQNRIAGLRNHLDEIDAKAVALKSIQEASAISGVTDALDFEVVERQVQDLTNKIDVELTYQEYKWEETRPEGNLASLDTIIRETSTASDTVSEIDKLLGGN